MTRPGLAIALALGVLALAPTTASAQVACDTLTNPVYLQVGDTQQPLMKNLGRKLRDDAGHPVTLVYITSGSCTNIDAIRNDTPITVNMLYVPSTAEDPAWDPATSAALPCTVGAGRIPDVANSNVFISACTSTPLPATIGVYKAPVQAYVMAVPEASTETALTFEEAYFVFGFGTAGMITPWDDEAQMFIRTITKSTLLSWAANISVPADKWKGVRYDSSSMVVGALTASTAPAKAIGILGAEVYDGKRDVLNELAYRASGQYLAYYPDSTPTSFDKKNVRDGHYTVWSPTIYMTKVDGGGAPLDPEAGRVIDMIRGLAVTPAPDFNPLTSVTAVGLIPDCAMKVTRSFEGGDFTLYDPPEPCVCSYEDLVDTTTCAACGPSTPCTSGTCRNGFCEEH